VAFKKKIPKAWVKPKLLCINIAEITKQSCGSGLDFITPGASQSPDCQ
jgi:hypothetical protein